MKPAGILALLVLAAALAPPASLLAAPAAGGTQPAGPAPATVVRLVTLKNGMQLLLAPDSSATATDVAVWYRAGTKHEHAGITGISHLFEHMMFDGSAHYGPQEHSRLVQAEGGTANAYTAPDYACYYETIPPAALELVFRLEADRIASLKLGSGALDAEKRMVREEKRWRADSGPAGRALQRLYRLAWATHPYRWPLVGLDEDLDHITLADCQQYFEDHYAPNNALVTVVGDFDPELALKAAQRWLEPLTRRRVMDDAPALEPTQTGERRRSEPSELPFAQLVVGWKTPGRPDPDAAELGLLAHLLVGGPDSRL